MLETKKDARHPSGAYGSIANIFLTVFLLNYLVVFDVIKGGVEEGFETLGGGVLAVVDLVGFAANILELAATDAGGKGRRINVVATVVLTVTEGGAVVEVVVFVS